MARLGKRERIMIQQWNLKKTALTFTLDLKPGSKSLHNLNYPTSTIYVKYKPKVDIIHNYTWSWKVTLKTEVWLDLDLETWFKVTVHPSPTRHSVGEIWARLGQVEKYVQDMWYWTDRLIRHQQSRAFKKYL